ncbi:TetR/AcrR family transcriptional regulator [Flaviaesturariibacter flavus]|nr:TetR/AcrR family transcriptional regulator [Flaviaesturariibacter flavus]
MEPKQRILQKADELFKRYGIRSVSMDDIAAQVGMSKKTLYQYYVDKEELVNAVFSTMMDENKASCGSCIHHAENAIHEVFLQFDQVQVMLSEMNPSLLYDMEKYHAPTFAKFKAYQNEFLYGIIRSNFERGVAEGLYRDNFDIEIITRFRIHTIMVAFNMDLFPASRTNLLYVEQQLLDLFLYGIATAKGERLIQKYKKQRTKN